MTRPVARALRASGLPVYWAGQYACMRNPESAAAAREHVVETVAALALPYRWVYLAALRCLPAAFFVATGQSVHHAPARVGRTGMVRLGALPGYAQVVRVSTALALYGALDGLPRDRR